MMYSFLPIIVTINIITKKLIRNAAHSNMIDDDRPLFLSVLCKKKKSYQ